MINTITATEIAKLRIKILKIVLSLRKDKFMQSKTIEEECLELESYIFKD